MQPHDSFQMIRLSMTLGIFQGLFQTFDDLEVHLKVIQPRLSFPRPFQLSLACFRVARSPSNSWDSCWFRPHNDQNLLPKICTCTKSPYISRLVWQIDRRCFDLRGGFRGWPMQWNHAKCCGADPCCHGNEIWARRGDPVAYRLVHTYSCTYVHEYVLFIYFITSSRM